MGIIILVYLLELLQKTIKMIVFDNLFFLPFFFLKDCLIVTYYDKHKGKVKLSFISR